MDAKTEPRTSPARRVFPAHWTQMFAGIAMASLAVLILSGAYLALFFDPSSAEVIYRGPLAELRGVPMTRAYESALQISFETRGGLFARQLHDWSAMLFVAAVLANLAGMFFTGGFRKPRRSIWALNVALLVVGVFVAFTGVLMLGDMLSDTSLRAISGYVLSIPVIGSWLHWSLFGGELPGTDLMFRLYLAHIVLAVVAVALTALWLKLLRRHGFPRFRGQPQRVLTRQGVVARSVALFAGTTGMLALLAGLFQVNPIWNYGPANAAHVSAGSTPPWFFGWVDGSVRLWPAWEIYLGDYAIAATFWPAIVFLPLSFLLLGVYPWLERRVTHDDGAHEFLERPRDVPGRTAFGVMVIVFYAILQLAAAIDVLSYQFSLSSDALLLASRIGLFVLPPLAYLVTHRLCLGLQRHDQEILEHGVETGIIKRLPHGGFVEVHQPLGGTRPDGEPVPLPYAGTPVPKKVNQLLPKTG